MVYHSLSSRARIERGLSPSTLRIVPIFQKGFRPDRSLPPPVQTPLPLASAADFRLRGRSTTAIITITPIVARTVISSRTGEFLGEIDLVRLTKIAPVKFAMQLFEFLLIGFPGLIVLVSILALLLPVLPVRGEFVLTRRPGVRKGHRNAFPK